MHFGELLTISDMVSEEHLHPESASGVSADPIDTLTPVELDALPFGAIQLDDAGTILQYNNYESRLAGVERSRAIGRNLFTDIAPCTNVQEFRGHFAKGVARRKLHIQFQYHFAFKQNPQDVTVTLYYSELSKSTVSVRANTRLTDSIRS
jgi:photoactive yellow protein